ncbi:MAG: 3-deoxy-8-phosphooctulonate synthase [Candidatus Cloacimonetes bacterium]|nr:3-deoxy-8-phosphooctulonate synthase [Candidatus Cloacimonadota bacterium]
MNLYNKLKETDKFFVIAGPCVIEDEKITLQIAESLKEYTQKRGLELVFKASFLKANRTSIGSYAGPGISSGLNILRKVKEEFLLPILTDIHESEDAVPTAEIADIIQIPAFLSRQTFLIKAAAATGRIVNIKKGQFMAPEDMESAIEKCLDFSNSNILLTERGTTFGYHNLVVDFRSFAIMNDMGYPVVYDVTHSLQQPSSGKTTGGTPHFAEMMARAALATGKVKGLFIETHPNPSEAKSDSATMLPLGKFEQMLDRCLEVL